MMVQINFAFKVAGSRFLEGAIVFSIGAEETEDVG